MKRILIYFVLQLTLFFSVSCEAKEVTSVNIGEYGSQSFEETVKERKVRRLKQMMKIDKLIRRKSEKQIQATAGWNEAAIGKRGDRDYGRWTGRDDRIIVKMPYKLREFFLMGMRRHLVRLQRITLALAQKDFKEAERAAREFILHRGILGRLVRTGNEAFNYAAINMHAIESKRLVKAIQTNDQTKAYLGLSRFMRTCETCHRAYKFIEWPKQPVYKEIGLTTPVPLPNEFTADDFRANKKVVQ